MSQHNESHEYSIHKEQYYSLDAKLDKLNDFVHRIYVEHSCKLENISSSLKAIDSKIEQIEKQQQLLRETVFGNGKLDSLINRVNILWFITIGIVTILVGSTSLWSIFRLL
jgi:hypothetical protein